MKHLIKALDSGKKRGYDEVRPLDSIRYLFQYAIRKEKQNYITYFLRIDESKYDVFEDYANETILTFPTLEDALQSLESEGADINKLGPIKGALPF